MAGEYKRGGGSPIERRQDLKEKGKVGPVSSYLLTLIYSHSPVPNRG